MKNQIEDFLAFRTLLAPFVIRVLFWLGCAASITTGVLVLASLGDAETVSDITGVPERQLQQNGVAWAIFFILVGPILIRLACENLVVFFRINNTLSEVRSILKEQAKPAETAAPK